MKFSIGSGDVKHLMSGKDTKGHQELLDKFINGDKVQYNALASPIDAMRIGAILEQRYAEIMPLNCFPQVIVRSDKMDVFHASLDFAFLKRNKVVLFHELKSVNLIDFIALKKLLRGKTGREKQNLIKAKRKENYYQIQEQIYCANLNHAFLVFVAVLNDNDEENWQRHIKGRELLYVRIARDNEVITQITERGKHFQVLRDFYQK